MPEHKRNVPLHRAHTKQAYILGKPIAWVIFTDMYTDQGTQYGTYTQLIIMN